MSCDHTRPVFGCAGCVARRDETHDEQIARMSPDQRDAFEERSAIMQHDGGLSKQAAERAALARIARGA